MTVKQLELEAEIPAHEEAVWGISVHSVLPILATCSSDKTSKIYDIENLDRIKEIKVLDEQTHTKTIRSVSFKPSSKKEYPTLALGSFDSTCSVWGADSYKSEWELLAVIEGHENEVKCIDWSVDGKYLATCARDKTIWVWETDEMNEEFECISVLNEHEGDVKSVKWNTNADGNAHAFMSCSYDDTMRVWRQDQYDEDEWNCVAIIRFECTVWGATWVDDATIACCTDDGEVALYERVDLEGAASSEAEGQPGLPNTIKKTEQWRVNEKFSSLASKIHNGPIYSIDSRNGKIVSGGSDGVIVVYEQHLPGEWSISSLTRMAHGVREINCVKLGHDDRILSCGDDGTVRVWK